MAEHARAAEAPLVPVVAPRIIPADAPPGLLSLAAALAPAVAPRSTEEPPPEAEPAQVAPQTLARGPASRPEDLPGGVLPTPPTWDWGEALEPAPEAPELSPRERLAAARKERSDIERATRDWAVLPRFEALLSRIDGLLAEPELHPERLRDAKRGLIEQWRGLGPLPVAEAPRLEAALQARLDAVAARLRMIAVARDEALQGNVTARRALIEALRALTPEGARDGLPPLLDAWRSAGSVPKADMEPLQQAWRAALDALHGQRQAGRQAIQEQRAAELERLRRLTEQAESLTRAQDVEAAVNGAKTLQAMWREVRGAGPQEAKDALWARFRAACDTIFARRSERREANRQQVLTRKQAVVDKARALAEEGVVDADTVIHGLMTEWRKLGPLSGDQGDALWNDLRAACDRLRRPLYEEAPTEELSLVFQPFATLEAPLQLGPAGKRDEAP
jgi:hypothetical protein